YAFGIWGAIFSAETAFVVWQGLPANHGARVVADGVGPFFAAACVLQAVWSVAFAQELLSLSAVILVALAASLFLAVRGLAPFKKSGASAVEYLLVHFPIGLHAGWVCAAALVNVNLALVGAGVGTAGQVSAAIVSLLAATGAAWTAAAVYNDTFFLLSVAWAFLAIAVNRDYQEKVLGDDVAQGFRNA
ncbi:unnamed protein product, partial [Phaeothamnion confervicola]